MSLKRVVCFITGVVVVLLSAGWSQAQEMALRVVVREDSSIFVYHTANMRVGYGFNLYRKLPGENEFTLLTSQPVYSVRTGQEFARIVGMELLEALKEATNQSTASGILLALQGNPVKNALLSYIYPRVAIAMGRLYVDKLPLNGQRVAYRVELVNGQGKPTGEVGTAEVVLKPTEAPPPQIVRAESEGQRFSITWRYLQSDRAKDDKIVRFEVYEVSNGEPQRLNKRIYLRNNATDTFVFHGRLPYGSHELYVAAIDITGRIAGVSPRVTISIQDNEPPRQIQSVQALVTQKGYVWVSWAPGVDADIKGYKVFRGSRLANPFKEISNRLLTPLETFFVDSLVTGGRQYFYRVVAVDSAGNEGTPSASVLVKVPDKEAPGAPANLQVQFVPETKEVHLSWEAPLIPDLKTFLVLRRRLSHQRRANAFSQLNLESLLQPSWIDRGEAQIAFEPGAWYEYAVVAMDSSRNFSDTVRVVYQIPDFEPPPAPEEVEAINERGRRVRILWKATMAGDVVRYRIFRGTVTQPLQEIGTRSYRVRQFVDTTVVPGETYVYGVVAEDSLGNRSITPAQDTLHFQDFTPPRRVVQVQAVVYQGEEGATISWEPVGGKDVVGYRLYRSTRLPTGKYELIYEGTETLYRDESGKPAYWYRVRVIDRSGNESKPSKPVQAHVVQRNNNGER